MTDSNTGVRLLAAVIGFWLLMRAVNRDATGRTLVDYLVGNKQSQSPYLSATIGEEAAGAAATTTSTPATTLGGLSSISPFAKATGFVLGREDMGVDASMKAGSPILAPQQSVYLGKISNWFEGEPYEAFQLPNGQNYYLAEQITPAAGLTPGQVIPAGQPIAYYAGSGTGIEMGWAGGGAQPGTWMQTLAQAKGDPGEANPAAGSSTTYGGSFLSWLKSL